MAINHHGFARIIAPIPCTRRRMISCARPRSTKLKSSTSFGRSTSILGSRRLWRGRQQKSKWIILEREGGICKRLTNMMRRIPSSRMTKERFGIQPTLHDCHLILLSSNCCFTHKSHVVIWILDIYTHSIIFSLPDISRGMSISSLYLHFFSLKAACV